MGEKKEQHMQNRFVFIFGRRSEETRAEARRGKVCKRRRREARRGEEKQGRRGKNNWFVEGKTSHHRKRKLQEKRRECWRVPDLDFLESQH